MDKLLSQLKETSSGTSLCGLYLGGAAHADDVRTIASSASVAEEQGQIIYNFSLENGLKLNSTKTEIVKISQSKNHEQVSLHLLNHRIETTPHAVCLGYMWSHNLSAKQGIKLNINKARRQFFALGSSGCFLGHSNPLSAREVVETCVIPTLLYGAENWSLDEGCLELLENFQAEIGRRILKLSRFHSSLAVRIGLSLPSITSRILIQKLTYLSHLLSSDDDDSIATRTFKTIASQNVYNLSLVMQCIFLDSKLKTNCTAQILNDLTYASSSLRAMKKIIASTDKHLMLNEASKHQSVSLASEINWLRIWETARDRGLFWTKITQSFFKLMTKPLFGERTCNKCESPIPEDISFFRHLIQTHTPNSIDVENLLADLRSQDSDPHTSSLHCMRTLVSLFN